MKTLFVLFLFAFLFSCLKESTNINNNNEANSSNSELQQNNLIGTWRFNESRSSNGIQIFEKYSKVHDEAYYLIFEVEPNMKIYSGGRCGTPPVTYHFYEGAYVFDGITLQTKMKSNFFRDSKYSVVLLSEKELKIKLL